MEQEQVVSTQFPPYFDRFINEREHRLIAELRRPNTNIAHNLRHIDQLRREIERSVTDAKEYREMAREERRLGAASAKQEREAIYVSAEEKLETIRVKAKKEREAIHQETRQGFVEAKQEGEAIRAEAKVEREAIRLEAKQEREAIRVEAKGERKAIRVEAREEREAIRQEMRQGFAEAKKEREAIRETIQREVGRLEAKMDNQFRWLMALQLSIVVGILAVVARVFFVGIMP